MEAKAPLAFVPSPQHPPLRFDFVGYSVWLELAQREIDDRGRGDLDRAIRAAEERFRLGSAIPAPHVTALYGIETGADEAGMRRVFREDVRRVLVEEAASRRNREGTREDRGENAGKWWPDLAATGIIVGAEFDGVNGGTMDMAWAEVSFATSPAHEGILDALHDVFYRPSAAAADHAASSPPRREEREANAPRSGPWLPHLSLCYDNPEGFGPNMSRAAVEDLLREQCPTLAPVLDEGGGGERLVRSVSGISLWKTSGSMADWRCLDKFEFPYGGVA